VTIEGSLELNTAVGEDPTDVDTEDEARLRPLSSEFPPLWQARAVHGSSLLGMMKVIDGSKSSFMESSTAAMTV
jgi:hypothetical protein